MAKGSDRGIKTPWSQTPFPEYAAGICFRSETEVDRMRAIWHFISGITRPARIERCPRCGRDRMIVRRLLWGWRDIHWCR